MSRLFSHHRAIIELYFNVLLTHSIGSQVLDIGQKSTAIGTPRLSQEYNFLNESGLMFTDLVAIIQAMNLVPVSFKRFTYQTLLSR